MRLPFANAPKRPDDQKSFDMMDVDDEPIRINLEAALNSQAEKSHGGDEIMIVNDAERML